MNGYKIGLCTSMSLSILCIIGSLIDGRGLIGLLLVFLTIIPGFFGIYFTTKITMDKLLKSFLFIVNYLFVTHLHIRYFIQFLTRVL
ncbi:hypothetical protein IGK38_000647 [Enterococcus pernyi]